MNVDQNAALQRFQAEVPRLRRLAYHMLGTVADADDLLQEAWLRFAHARSDGLRDTSAWLTTVTSRLALDLLRQRKRRAQEPLPDLVSDDPVPEEELILRDEIGQALMAVLGQASAVERVAFVLHDALDLPFDTIAPILDRSPAAVRQAASRARRRIRLSADVQQERIDREIVTAFVCAARAGDFATLVTLLDPDATLQVDARLLPPGAPATTRGGSTIASRAILGAAGKLARFTQFTGRPAIAIGVPVTRVMIFRIQGGRVTHIDITAPPGR
jgi:RNA polymerase sigma-70 factor (ECF subfamily)